jgi:hypothetical protein
VHLLELAWQTGQRQALLAACTQQRLRVLMVWVAVALLVVAAATMRRRLR